MADESPGHTFASLVGTLAGSFVAVGASAGGLDACTRLAGAMTTGHGMAMILVQHLDPNHDSLMVDLLASHTPFVVEQATEGAQILADHLYIIPPGCFLSVRGFTLHLEQPPTRHGAHMPLDLLLESLAEQHGQRTVGIVLSGTGSDGSIGLQALKAAGGYCIAQTPAEAGYDAMPTNAIATGAIDRTADAAAIPAIALERLKTGQRRVARRVPISATNNDQTLADILDTLKQSSAHDFSAYKQGTVLRRVERRMALAGIAPGAMAKYLTLVQSDAAERQVLASDLLINVTSFFRDPKVFDYMAEYVLPELIAEHPKDRKIRVWTAGCSTGEEAYSLAMLLREAVEASGKDIGIQIFASDADEDAVTVARTGLYSESIADVVPQDRLSRFFTKEAGHYRVLPELRSMVASWSRT